MDFQLKCQMNSKQLFTANGKKHNKNDDQIKAKLNVPNNCTALIRWKIVVYDGSHNKFYNQTLRDVN